MGAKDCQDYSATRHESPFTASVYGMKIVIIFFLLFVISVKFANLKKKRTS